MIALEDLVRDPKLWWKVVFVRVDKYQKIFTLFGASVGLVLFSFSAVAYFGWQRIAFNDLVVVSGKASFTQSERNKQLWQIYLVSHSGLDRIPLKGACFESRLVGSNVAEGDHISVWMQRGAAVQILNTAGQYYKPASPRFICSLDTAWRKIELGFNFFLVVSIIGSVAAALSGFRIRSLLDRHRGF